MRHTDLAERSRTHHYQNTLRSDAQGAAYHHRQSFHHPRTSLGAAGHWIHLLSVAAPLVIAEVIKDPDKKWRALRGVSVGAALLSEAVWTHRLMKERRKDDESYGALEA